MRKRTKTIATWVGAGELFRDGVQVGRVHYRIQQDQEFLIEDSIDGRSEGVPGRSSTSGAIMATEGRIELQQYSLRMEDGRELDVLVTNMSVPGRPCAVLGSGKVREPARSDKPNQGRTRGQ